MLKHVLVLCAHLINEPLFSAMHSLIFKASSVTYDVAQMHCGPIATKLCLFLTFLPAQKMSNIDLLSKELSQFTAWFKEKMKLFRDCNF